MSTGFTFENNMRKIWRNISLILIFLILLGLFGFVIWARYPAQPDTVALDALVTQQPSQEALDQNWLVFEAEPQEPVVGLILYPGGRVDYRAYAAHAQSIAEAGFTVVLLPMPLNFAFFGINRAADVIEAFQDVEIWAVGGHSLGGAMAAEFTLRNPQLVSGLVLWSAYPGQNADLSGVDVSVVSIYASNDGLATLEEINASKARLPVETTYINIEGGNHAGFGWYGVQNGDGIADISQEAQQLQIVDATVNFLRSLQE